MPDTEEPDRKIIQRIEYDNKLDRYHDNVEEMIHGSKLPLLPFSRRKPSDRVYFLNTLKPKFKRPNKIYVKKMTNKSELEYVMKI